jgi:hypothetical protein
MGGFFPGRLGCVAFFAVSSYAVATTRLQPILNAETELGFSVGFVGRRRVRDGFTTSSISKNKNDVRL